MDRCKYLTILVLVNTLKLTAICFIYKLNTSTGINSEFIIIKTEPLKLAIIPIKQVDITNSLDYLRKHTSVYFDLLFMTNHYQSTKLARLSNSLVMSK